MTETQTTTSQGSNASPLSGASSSSEQTENRSASSQARSEFESAIEEKMHKFEEILERMSKGSELKGLRNEIEDLRNKYTSVRMNYQRVKSASSDAFDDVKVGFQLAWNDLRGAMRCAADRLIALGQADKDSHMTTQPPPSAATAEASAKSEPASA